MRPNRIKDRRWAYADVLEGRGAWRWGCLGGTSTGFNMYNWGYPLFVEAHILHSGSNQWPLRPQSTYSDDSQTWKFFAESFIIYLIWWRISHQCIKFTQTLVGESHMELLPSGVSLGACVSVHHLFKTRSKWNPPCLVVNAAASTLVSRLFFFQ